jgi:type II secretory pathway component PulM
MSLLGNVREGAVRLGQRPVAYVTSAWERMSPRERRWVNILVWATVIVTIVIASWWTFSDISDLEESNANTREALTAINKHRDEYLEAKAKAQTQEARIGNDPPQLTADLEAAARDENVQIAESSERPTTPAGRRYVEHDVDLKFREVDLQALTKFMRRVETGPRLIFFTRLSIKRRYSEAEKLDVEATATAFERVHEEKGKKKAEAKTEGKKE